MFRTKRNAGQAMTEFTIVVMALLMLILGTLQFALIYHAKITLNYAAFETARAGAINNARMWAMELGFARSMAPLYTTPYMVDSGGTCTSTFFFNPDADAALPAANVVAANRSTTGAFTLDQVKCARQRVRDMVAGDLVRITLVNPSADSFADHGPFGTIPNDNLMFRSADVKSFSDQSIQDANLIKVNIGFCYELIVPLVDRLIWRMIATAPDALQPENFGPQAAGSFANACVTATETDGSTRYGIPIFSEAIMRMQSDAIEDIFCAGQCDDTT